mmetsp:Transcript_24062/g.74792  ORF Transcript_24062/g.74792 Transcript_24062/m.74792 type:complete len:284 (-) Transcript_24062:1217-2068(-)
MDNGGNLVDEHHGVLLENVGARGKVPDAAPAVDCLDFRAGDQRVHHVVVVVQVLADDLATGLAKAERQQGAELDDRVLEDFCLQRRALRLHTFLVLGLLARPDPRLLPRLLRGVRHLAGPAPILVPRVLLVRQADGVEWVLADHLHLADHPLYRHEHQLVGVPTEEQGADGQHEHDEGRLHHAQDGLPLHALSDIEDKDKLALHVLPKELEHGHVRHVPHGLLQAERAPGAGQALDEGDPYDLRLVLGLDLDAAGRPRPREGQLDVPRERAHSVLRGPHAVRA